MQGLFGRLQALTTAYPNASAPLYIANCCSGSAVTIAKTATATKTHLTSHNTAKPRKAELDTLPLTDLGHR